jgi:hypothetical protein
MVKALRFGCLCVLDQPFVAPLSMVSVSHNLVYVSLKPFYCTIVRCSRSGPSASAGK